MIISIEITGLRGIRQGKLDDLTALTVLVGPNGCGKSTILDALLIGASPDVQDAGLRAVERHRGVERGARWFMWRANEKGQAVIKVSTNDGASRRCCVKPKSDTALDVAFPDIFAQSLSVPEIRLIEPRVFDTRPPLHELYTAAVVHGRRDQATALISQIVPQAKHLEILTDGNKPIVHLVFEDHSVPVALSGDGVYSLVRLILELAARPDGVVLIEEPEVHQHPGAIRQTVQAILAAVKRDIQVILTTHSLELIDLLLAESSEEDLEKLSLYRLALREGELIARRMPGAEVAFSRCEIEKDLR